MYEQILFLTAPVIVVTALLLFPNAVEKIFDFICEALAKLGQRLFIFLMGTIIGFVGPIISIKHPQQIFVGPEMPWNNFAYLVNQTGHFGDIIIACLPVVYVCLAEFFLAYNG